jgi:hypothetical protein
MSPRIFQKPVNFQLVIHLAKNNVSVVLAVRRATLKLRIRVKLNSDCFVGLTLQLHRFRYGSEMSDRVIVFFFQFVKIAKLLNGLRA